MARLLVLEVDFVDMSKKNTDFIVVVFTHVNSPCAYHLLILFAV